MTSQALAIFARFDDFVLRWRPAELGVVDPKGNIFKDGALEEGRFLPDERDLAAVGAG